MRADYGTMRKISTNRSDLILVARSKLVILPISMYDGESLRWILHQPKSLHLRLSGRISRVYMTFMMILRPGHFGTPVWVGRLSTVHLLLRS
jgi:hypothetical protein